MLDPGWSHVGRPVDRLLGDGHIARRGKGVSFDTAKQVVRRDLAKARMRPNFGNAGAVENSVSAAVVPLSTRLGLI